MTHFFANSEELARHIDQHHMEVDANRHTLEGIWDKLSKEEVQSFCQYLTHTINSDYSVNLINQSMLLGSLQRILASKFNICFVDGIDHTQEEKELLTPPLESKPAKPSTREEYRANMKKWNVALGVDGTLHCAKCAYPIVSLEDRMMKDPDECPGCIHKAKFG